MDTQSHSAARQRRFFQARNTSRKPREVEPCAQAHVMLALNAYAKPCTVADIASFTHRHPHTVKRCLALFESREGYILRTDDKVGACYRGPSSYSVPSRSPLFQEIPEIKRLALREWISSLDLGSPTRYLIMHTLELKVGADRQCTLSLDELLVLMRYRSQGDLTSKHLASMEGTWVRRVGPGSRKWGGGGCKNTWELPAINSNGFAKWARRRASKPAGDGTARAKLLRILNAAGQRGIARQHRGWCQLLRISKTCFSQLKRKMMLAAEIEQFTNPEGFRALRALLSSAIRTMEIPARPQMPAAGPRPRSSSGDKKHPNHTWNYDQKLRAKQSAMSAKSYIHYAQLLDALRPALPLFRSWMQLPNPPDTFFEGAKTAGCVNQLRANWTQMKKWQPRELK